jgi:hypothetical protein
MVKRLTQIAIVVVLLSISADLWAQCSLCTKTAQQLGEGPARGLNMGILMLAFTPLGLIGFLGYKWWKSQQGSSES